MSLIGLTPEDLELQQLQEFLPETFEALCTCRTNTLGRIYCILYTFCIWPVARPVQRLTHMHQCMFGECTVVVMSCTTS